MTMEHKIATMNRLGAKKTYPHPVRVRWDGLNARCPVCGLWLPLPLSPRRVDTVMGSRVVDGETETTCRHPVEGCGQRFDWSDAEDQRRILECREYWQQRSAEAARSLYRKQLADGDL